MLSRRLMAAITLVAAVLTASACVRISAGTPVAASSAATSSTATSSTVAAPTTDTNPPGPGVVPTTRAPVPADAVTCSPSSRPVVAVLAQIADPRAPRVTVAVPEGWGMSAGSGDVGAQLSGPDGASATITIASTTLDPEAAFQDYAAKLAAGDAVSVQPAPLCDYSGQTLKGSSTDGVAFTDHIVHVWTNAGNYLIAVHVQTPPAAETDRAASDLLTNDFEIRLP